MMHLLKLEWLKIKNYRTFWIIFILYLVSIAGANYLVNEWSKAYFSHNIKKNPTDAVLRMLIGKPPFNFPQAWQMVSQAASYLLIIPGLLTIILATNEYNYKTHRQNVIDGMTRQRFISSKLLLVIMMAIIATLVIALTAVIFGYTVGTAPFSTEKLYYVGYAFIQFLNYCFLALLISVLFRRSGISMGVYFLYVIVFDNILFFVLNRYVYNTGYFLPSESADGLIQAPIFEGIQKQLLTRPDFKYIIATCIAYIILYVVLSYRRFQKADL